MTYNLILADPPWKYDNNQSNDPARGGFTYPSMSMKELAALDVQSLAADNAHCVLWVTMPKLVDHEDGIGPMQVMKAWGFEPVTTLFAWVKLNKRADSARVEDLYKGLGYYTQSNIEIALIGRSGKALPRLARNVSQVIVAPIGAHSAKPQEQYTRLHALFGDVPRIELFARSQNPPPNGWVGIGVEYNGETVQDYIKRYSTERRRSDASNTNDSH